MGPFKLTLTTDVSISSTGFQVYFNDEEFRNYVKIPPSTVQPIIIVTENITIITIYNETEAVLDTPERFQNSIKKVL